MDKTEIQLWQRNEVTRWFLEELRKDYVRDLTYLEKTAGPEEYRRFQGKCDVYRKILGMVDAKTG